MSITDLCGSLKSFSDLRRHPIKNRYTESTEIKSSAGAWFRMTLSRHSDANGPWFLDCRKVFLRFKMKIAEVGGQKSWVDGPTAAVLFDRVKIICGSTVLVDIQNHSLLATLLENIHHSNATESPALRTLRVTEHCNSASPGGKRTHMSTSLMPLHSGHFCTAIVYYP